MGSMLTATASRRPFKRCPSCRFVWRTPADFLNDADLRCIGQQEAAQAGNPGMVLFNHSCGTTLAINMKRLMVLKASGNG